MASWNRRVRAHWSARGQRSWPLQIRRYAKVTRRVPCRPVYRYWRVGLDDDPCHRPSATGRSLIPQSLMAFIEFNIIVLFSYHISTGQTDRQHDSWLSNMTCAVDLYNSRRPLIRQSVYIISIVSGRACVNQGCITIYCPCRRCSAGHPRTQSAQTWCLIILACLVTVNLWQNSPHADVCGVWGQNLNLRRWRWQWTELNNFLAKVVAVRNFSALVVYKKCVCVFYFSPLLIQHLDDISQFEDCRLV